MGAPRSPYNSSHKKVTLLHNAAESYAIHHLRLTSASPPALVLPAMVLGMLANKNQ
jgi:hypothetical protein